MFTKAAVRGFETSFTISRIRLFKGEQAIDHEGLQEGQSATCAHVGNCAKCLDMYEGL